MGGWHDSVLTPDGLRDAAAIARAPRAEIPGEAEVDLVSSDLLRTRRTAQEIGTLFGGGPSRAGGSAQTARWRVSPAEPPDHLPGPGLGAPAAGQPESPGVPEGAAGRLPDGVSPRSGRPRTRWDGRRLRAPGDAPSRPAAPSRSPKADWPAAVPRPWGIKAPEAGGAASLRTGGGARAARPSARCRHCALAAGRTTISLTSTCGGRETA
ncbi:histidine phosphatase family protein [Streptomyces sp. LE64]|uniref:histidine phosphatase family protein n=1 Tax=Streptomyces sp. LE64 TaxID=3448653 RepID=UPI00404209E6